MSGMEGSPVFSEQGQFIGLLTRPLRQKISGTEVQVCRIISFPLFIQHFVFIGFSGRYRLMDVSCIV